MFAGYFDASGTALQPCLAVAGFAASIEQWQEFEGLWLGRLRKDDLEFFHATEVHQNWKSDPKRLKALYVDLIVFSFQPDWSSLGVVLSIARLIRSRKPRNKSGGYAPIASLAGRARHWFAHGRGRLAGGYQNWCSSGETMEGGDS